MRPPEDASYETLVAVLSLASQTVEVGPRDDVSTVPLALVAQLSDTGDITDEACAAARTAWSQYNDQRKRNFLRTLISEDMWSSFSSSQQASKRRRVVTFLAVDAPSERAASVVDTLQERSTIREAADDLLTNGNLPTNPELAQALARVKEILRTDQSDDSTLSRVLSSFDKDSVPSGAAAVFSSRIAASYPHVGA